MSDVYYGLLPTIIQVSGTIWVILLALSIIFKEQLEKIWKSKVKGYKNVSTLNKIVNYLTGTGKTTFTNLNFILFFTILIGVLALNYKNSVLFYVAFILFIIAIILLFLFFDRAINVIWERKWITIS